MRRFSSASAFRFLMHVFSSAGSLARHMDLNGSVFCRARFAAPHDYVAMQDRCFAYEAAHADKYQHEAM